jgi:hypothetical protein
MKKTPDLANLILEDYLANTKIEDCWLCELPIYHTITWWVNVDGVDEPFHGDCKLEFMDSMPGGLSNEL